MEKRKNWIDWATYDEDGFINGIMDNAPEDARLSYEQYLKEKESQKKRNIKV